MGKTIRFVRSVRQHDVRSYVQGYLDEALASRGYVRRPSGLAQALPMLGAFGAGVAVGTGIGVLIAPASGAETRAKMSARLERAMKKAREAARTRADGHRRIIVDDPEITHEHPMGDS
jgi:hypothetical protein